MEYPEGHGKRRQRAPCTLYTPRDVKSTIAFLRPIESNIPFSVLPHAGEARPPPPSPIMRRSLHHLRRGLRASPLSLLLGLALLATEFATPAAAQAQRVLHGRITGTDEQPVPGAAVTVLSAAGEEVSARTDSSGLYAVIVPPGERFELTAERTGFRSLTVDVEFPSGVGRARRDLRLSPLPIALEPLEVRGAPPPAPARPITTPGGGEETMQAAVFSTFPVRPGELADLAALEPGVRALPGGGLVIGGQPPGQSSTTLDGATFGSTTLPAEALAKATVIPVTFDPARGEFSGGQVAGSTPSGTALFGGAVRLRLTDPALQAAPAGDANRLMDAGGGAGGPLLRDQVFWYGAGQLTRFTSPRVTLENADPGTLLELGIEPAAREQLRSFAERVGYAAPGEITGEAARSSASGLLRLDLVPHPDHLVVLRLDGRQSTADGLGSNPFTLARNGASRTEEGGGVLAQWTARVAGARSELRVSGRGERTGSTPGLRLPSARVWSAGVPLGFGGAAGEEASSASRMELSEELALPLAPRHRVKVGGMVSRDGATREAVHGAGGTFTFGTVDDLEAGRPSAYSRVLGSRRGRATTTYAAAFAGHLWTPSEAWSLLSGVRVERRDDFASSPGGVADTGGAAGEVPPRWGVSPRLGFSFAPPGSGLIVRGGTGEFRGVIPVRSLAAAGATGGERLLCLGAAAPRPEWGRYAAGVEEAPSTCADGAAHLASELPEVTVYDRSTAAPRIWRTHLEASWDRVTPLGQAAVRAQAGWTRGLSQPLARDLNFARRPGFTLPDEGGRVVFAPLSAVDPGGGGIAPGATRRVDSLGVVRGVSSGGRSRTLELGVGGVLWMGNSLVSVDYRLTRVVDEVGSLQAPWGFSEPLSAPGAGGRVRGTSDLEREHQLQLQLSQRLPGFPGEVAAVARLTSGQPYTPRSDADLDGDGEANDAAFVFRPDALADADTDTRAAMESLLAGSGSAAACLRAQLGRIAERNRCRGPWTATLDVQADFWPRQEYRARRLTLTLLAANVPAGLDRLLFGGERGWGREAYPDPVLLHVRGFSPERRAFLYEVNPRFGRDLALGSAFALTLQLRWTLGSDPLRQPLLARVAAVRLGGRSAEELRAELARTVPNLPAQLLALAPGLGLELTPEQAERITAGAEAFRTRAGPLVDSLAAAVETLEHPTDRDATAEARRRSTRLAGELQAAVEESHRLLREILRPEQWHRVPPAIQVPLRQLVPERRGAGRRAGDW